MGSVYIIISPVRNEEGYIEKTLDSVVSQTMLPLKWFIIDDGSTDSTPLIVKGFAEKFDFIELIDRPQNSGDISVVDRIAKAAPPRAFNYGLKILGNMHFDFIVKLDGDLSFDSDYFERLLKEFDKNPRLGIASGFTLFPGDRGFWGPKDPDEHVFGCSKVYRRECFQDIGGIVEVLGWDTIDEVKAQIMGWQTRHFKDIELIHWRLMGTASGFVRGKMRHGFTNYYLGYHPLYMVARILWRMTDRPYLINGILLGAGFLSGYLKGVKQFPDDEFKKFLRESQIRYLKQTAKKVLQRNHLHRVR